MLGCCREHRHWCWLQLLHCATSHWQPCRLKPLLLLLLLLLQVLRVELPVFLPLCTPSTTSAAAASATYSSSGSGSSSCCSCSTQLLPQLAHLLLMPPHQAPHLHVQPIHLRSQGSIAGQQLNAPALTGLQLLQHLAGSCS